jgi:hypothetical protein
VNDPAILFVKPKAISQSDKKMLQQAGILVVEIDNPADAKFIRANSELSSTEMLAAAAKAMTESQYGGEVRKAFATAVCEALLSRAKQTGAVRGSPSNHEERP